MARKKFSDEDALMISERLLEQFKQDREWIVSQYLDLKSMVSGNIDKYATTGDVLVKSAELLTKQSAQLLDFLKIIKKDTEKDDGLSEDDLMKISESIRNKDE